MLPTFSTSVEIPGFATAIVAFFAVFAAEIAWVLCVRWTAAARTLAAASMASGMVLIGWAGLIVLLGNPWVAIPSEMVGAFAGTYFAFYIDRRLYGGRIGQEEAQDGSRR